MRILLPYNDRARPDSFYTDFHAGLAEAAQELGHSTMRFDHADGITVSAAEHARLYQLLAEQSFDLVIDLCCWSHALSRLRAWDGTSEGEPLFDAFDIPYVGMLCDQPWFQPLTGIQSSRAHVAVPDRFHGEQIALIHPQLSLHSVLFAPPAGRLANDQSLRADREDKSIDVLYVGNLYADALERTWAGAPDASLYDEVLEWAGSHAGRPLHHAVLAVAQARGTPIDAAQATALLQRVEFCLRGRVRLDMVRAAAASGAIVHVVGDGWESVALPENVALHPFVNYADFLAMAAQARISLDASTYRHGANDRVFNYAMNNAVCFTNAAGFLGEVFGRDGGMHFHSEAAPTELAPAIRELLDAPGRLREDAARARELTLATQTWRHRLEAIIATVGGR